MTDCFKTSITIIRHSFFLPKYEFTYFRRVGGARQIAFKHKYYNWTFAYLGLSSYNEVHKEGIDIKLIQLRTVYIKLQVTIYKGMQAFESLIFVRN